MPEIGNEDSISSCGGSEWGEHVAYVEDEPLRILRGAEEDKTVLSTGSFSAGSRALPASRSDAASDCLPTETSVDTIPAPDAATATVHHCLMDPSSGRRVRVVQRVAAADGGGGGGWTTAWVEVWIEQKKTCVAPFAGEDPVSFNDDGNGGGGGWMMTERSASFHLAWPEESQPEAKDGGSVFVVEEVTRGAVGPAVAAGGSDAGDGGGAQAGGNLMRLPGGVWVRVEQSASPGSYPFFFTSPYMR